MNKLASLTFSFLLISCVTRVQSPYDSDCLFSGPDVIEIEILSYEPTDKPSRLMCYPDMTCWEYDYWYIYEGRVINRLKGKLDKDLVSFALSQHNDLMLTGYERVVVSLEEVRDDSLLDEKQVDYQVTEYCFVDADETRVVDNDI